MYLFDYIVNLSIFSLLVSTPLIIRSFISNKPFKHYKLWVGIYSGIVGALLVLMSIKYEGFSYDIRYAPVILVFAYIGTGSGLITGLFTILARMYMAGNTTTPLIGWTVIMIVFVILNRYTKQLTAPKRSFLYLTIYTLVYIILVPVIFNVFRDRPLFHLQYILFVGLGVITGILLIESYLRQFRLNTKLSDMYLKLENSERKYRLITENTSDFIGVMDRHYQMTYLSPSNKGLFGEDYHRANYQMINSLVHPDDRERVETAFSTMLENHEPQRFEFRIKHQDGYWVDLESRCMPVLGENNIIENIVMVGRDISERKKADEILLQSEKLSIVGELAAGVAHEIRNPLTTIKGFVQLYKAENSSFTYNDLLLDELERIENITSEMLSLGKPQAVQLKKASLQELIENTLELLAPQALMNAVQFRTDFKEEPLIVTCEQNQLKQVFLNIVKNAMEAMPKGGEISIDVRKGENDMGIISFQDNGCGIPEELLPRIGEPFYSLKEKGTGLGIMICQKIIKQHDGHIKYHSKVNEGTLVEITLPLG